MSDNQYVAAVVFYNIKNSEMLYGMQGFGEDKPGVTSHIKEYDITGFGETFGMIVHDYAGNSKVYTVRAPGNPDDHGTITPTNILWTENFNEKWLPDDWSVQSKGGSLNTWYRDEDYMAAVDHDDDNQQDEWLISRTTDISGVDTEVHMVFDFYTTYWYTVEYKHCNLQVMASGRRRRELAGDLEPAAGFRACSPPDQDPGQGDHPREPAKQQGPALRLCLHR